MMWSTLLITDGLGTWACEDGGEKRIVAYLFLAAAILSPADAGSDSSVTVEGGKFTCHAERNGGFLYATDRARVNIRGGLVSNNVADRKGGGVSGRRSLAVIRHDL